jgi:hypothetical protein
MGWRWRKSIGLPGGARATVSKGGVGFSWGFSGLRIGRSPTGEAWISFSIPGTGISFIKYLPSFRSQSATASPPQNPTASIAAQGSQPNQQPVLLTANQRLLEKIKKSP